MKKVFALLLISFVAASCLFAAPVSDTIGFFIRWRHVVAGSETMEVLEYDGENELENNTKIIEIKGGQQNVAMFRLTTNISGLYTLVYHATALQTQDGTAAVGYKLYFDHEGMVANISVGDDPGTTYPLSGMPTASTSFTVPTGIASPAVKDILIKAELQEYTEMRAGTYGSTVIIERVIN